MPKMFAACYHSTGDATIVVFTAKRSEMEEHDVLETRLEEAGYTGPFVFFDSDHYFNPDECEALD
jgi:hypothetical protein